jgi:hypothetical protein
MSENLVSSRSWIWLNMCSRYDQWHLSQRVLRYLMPRLRWFVRTRCLELRLDAAGWADILVR